MDPGEVFDACVVRQPKAYPVYDDAYARNVQEIRLEIGGTFRHCTLSAAMACTNTTIRTTR